MTIHSPLTRNKPEESPGSHSRLSAKNIEDIYPLSPLQQGTLFHSLYAPGSGVYIIQFHCTLQGDLKIAAFKRAWQHVVDRHSVFRTTFMWEGLREPLQVVHRQSNLAWEEQDWRGLSHGEQLDRVAEYLKADRTRDFDLMHGPLMRMSLIRTSNNQYYFTWSLHHLVTDGWSSPLVFKDVFAYYEAFRQGQELHLPPVPSYRDYIAWLQQQNQEQAESFWRAALQGFITPTLLPFDQAPGRKESTQAEMYEDQHIQLSETTTSVLHTLVSQQQLTLNTLLQGAWAVLLSRYSGECDVLFGATTSGRPAALPGIEFLVGPCINTLPVHVQIPTDARLLPWLKELQMQQVEARQYEYSSLVQIQGWSQVPRTLPLFETLLIFENYPIDFSFQKEDREIELDNIRAIEQTNYPLVVAVVPGQELSIQITYDRSRFERATIRRIAGHLQTVLESIADNPEQSVHELSLLTAAERQQMLVDWNATQTAYPKNTCIHQLFEAQVERTPDAVAVVFEDEQVTYQELNVRANQLAHHLQLLGVGPDVLVGICLERSLDMVVGLLGILKAGGAYVPLDPAFPAERLAFMLKDAQAPVLLTQQPLLTKLPAPGTKVVCLDADAVVLAQQREANPLSGTTAAQLAYVIYTSGSTGKPKGVQILHRAVVNFLLSMRSQPGLTAADTWLAITTLSFDIAALELFLPLLVGARVLVASRETATNGAALAETLRRGQVTVMQATPVTWRLLLAAGWQGKADLKILCGGEALPLDLAQQLLPRAASLWNMYGPTETTIWSTLREVAPGDEVISIGRPIANTQIYLLDAHLQPVPVGVPGELFIGGDGLARGYLNRPELTVERFLPHPFSDELGARLYRTGDLARYRSDGTIEHLGRLDFQVKLRGFRIELGEIEAVLAQHPAVRQAVVVVREDQRGDKRLVAYLVASQQPAPASSELRSFLQKQLPDYMLPSAFVCLEALPLTPNDKVNRRALPAPELTKRTAEETFVAPTLMVHYQLIKIWEELLDARPIGIKDNFLYLGGHSLLAVRLVNRIEQVFGKRISLATLFAGPTIERITNALKEEGDIDLHAPVVAVQTGGSRRPFFFMHGDYKGGAFYCFPLASGLGSDQPFYALEPYSFDGLRVPPTLEATAAAHIKLLRTVQPKGPYLLGGFCNGGLVAYEMARQLHAQGQMVDLLVLINPTRFAYRRWMRSAINRFGNLMRLGQEKQVYWFLWPRHLYRYLQHLYRYLRFPHYRRLQTELEPEQVNQNGGAILTLKPLHELWLSQGAERLGSGEQIEPGHRGNGVGFTLPRLDAIFPDAFFPTTEALCHDWVGLFTWAAANYVPGFYPAKSTFFFTRDWQAHGEDVEWHKVAEGKDQEIEVHVIAGTHDSCKTEHLHGLIERLRMCLSSTQKEPE